MTVCVHMSHAPGLTCLSSAAPKHDKGFHYKCLSGVLVARPGSFFFLLYMLRKTESFPPVSDSTQRSFVTQISFDCFPSFTRLYLLFNNDLLELFHPMKQLFCVIFLISNKFWSKFASFKHRVGKADLVQSATGFGKTSIF